MYGDKPYDKNITPVENLFVTIAAMGEFEEFKIRLHFLTVFEHSRLF